ncbi:hypothetical protein PJI17_28530 [Mycobacterium kansasii]
MSLVLGDLLAAGTTRTSCRRRLGDIAEIDTDGSNCYRWRLRDQRKVMWNSRLAEPDGVRFVGDTGLDAGCVPGRLSIPGPAGGKAAGRDQSRPIGSCTALALPTDVPSAGTLDGGHDHVPGQQPVATPATPGRSVRPVRCPAMRQLADVNTHRNTLASVCGPIPGWAPNRYPSFSALGRVVASALVPGAPHPRGHRVARVGAKRYFCSVNWLTSM